MTFVPDDDAESLRQVVREFLGKFSTEQDVRKLMVPDPDTTGTSGTACPRSWA